MSRRLYQLSQPAPLRVTISKARLFCCCPCTNKQAPCSMKLAQQLKLRWAQGRPGQPQAGTCLHTFHGKCDGACPWLLQERLPPQVEERHIASHTQVASSQAFWKQLEPSCFPLSSSVTEPEVPISCVMCHPPQAAFVAQCRLYRPTTSFGSLEQRLGVAPWVQSLCP